MFQFCLPNTKNNSVPMPIHENTLDSSAELNKFAFGRSLFEVNIIVHTRRRGICLPELVFIMNRFVCRRPCFQPATTTLSSVSLVIAVGLTILSEVHSTYPDCKFFLIISAYGASFELKFALALLY